MNLSSLIPQLFYDLIGRLIPGMTLVGLASLLHWESVRGQIDPRYWSPAAQETHIPTGIGVLGYILASYIVATLLGGVWFLISPLLWKKRGEDQLRKAFKINPLPETLPRDSPEALSNVSVEDIDFPDRVAFMYDYIQLKCPKAGSRIVKLRAEQHMSGVLMVGFLMLALINLASPLRKGAFWPLLIIETALACATLAAGWLALFLEGRSATALYNYWFLVWSGISKGEAATGKNPESDGESGG
jgi:hypothetical protein